MEGLKNFLMLVNDNWTTIAVCIGLIVCITKKVMEFISKSDDEKVAIVKKQVKEIMLRLVTDAEEEYADWNKAGSIKRSNVIDEIYNTYPILSKVTNQESLISFIDDAIDDALVELRKILKENENETEDEVTVDESINNQ